MFGNYLLLFSRKYRAWSGQEGILLPNIPKGLVSSSITSLLPSTRLFDFVKKKSFVTFDLDVPRHYLSWVQALHCRPPIP